MLQRNSLLALFFLGLALQSAAYGSTAEDEHIRQIVQSMLKEKDQKIERLEARIRQLEQTPTGAGVVLQNQVTAPHAKTAMPDPEQKSAAVVVQNQMPATPHTKAATPEPVKTAATAKTELTISSKFQELEKKIDEIKEAASVKGLEMGAFFDVNAKTPNSTDQTFSFGSLELDLDYAYNDHLGASAALVLCGNSSNADYGAPPAIFCGNSGAGGLSGGSTMAGIAVGFIDYNLRDDSIPPRGRIFNKDGLHIRAGRFDIPFGTDYQNFANTDRITVTAPLTTSIMQLGGYNGDGVNSFGARGKYQYSLFWTDAMYGNDGHAIGGRVGMVLGQRPYSVHSPQEGIQVGFSHLSDLDGDNNIRNSVYGADLSIGYGIWRLQSELMVLDSHQAFSIDADGNAVLDDFYNPLNKPNQLGYHTTLSVDLNSVINYPVLVFARFSRWQPKQKYALDFDGNTVVAVNDVSMLSVGLNYKFSDWLRMKFEYDDSLGTSTAERYFDKRVGIGQVVVSF